MKRFLKLEYGYLWGYMRALYILLCTVLIGNGVFAQSSNFELTYGRYMSCGLLHETEYPLSKIKNGILGYTYKQITSKYSEIEKYGEQDEKRDTIWRYKIITQYIKFRQTSEDSIINAIKQIQDTLIVSLSLSPGDFDVRTVTLKYDHVKKRQIDLVNTFDSNAIPIVNIINTYLPEEHKIEIPYEEWNRDIEYRKHFDSLYQKSDNR